MLIRIYFNSLENSVCIWLYVQRNVLIAISFANYNLLICVCVCVLKLAFNSLLLFYALVVVVFFFLVSFAYILHICVSIAMEFCFVCTSFWRRGKKNTHTHTIRVWLLIKLIKLALLCRVCECILDFTNFHYFNLNFAISFVFSHCLCYVSHNF